MGQHWMYDLEDSPGMSWISGNLLPIVPMYHAPGSTDAGKINAFFFASPKCQGPGNNGADNAYSWDNVPSIIGCGLPPNAMCENFCATGCSTSVFGSNPWSSSDTNHWATFHIFFNADPKSQPTCPGYEFYKNFDNLGAVAFHRTCPANTQTPNTNLMALRQATQTNSDSSSSGHSGTGVTVMIVVVVVAAVGAVAGFTLWYKKPQANVAEYQGINPQAQMESYAATPYVPKSSFNDL